MLSPPVTPTRHKCNVLTHTKIISFNVMFILQCIVCMRPKKETKGSMEQRCSNTINIF